MIVVGSGSKGLYSGVKEGTKGSLASSHKAVMSWATKHAESLSKTQRKKFNTACVAYDVESGEYFYGRNGGIERNGTPKHETLFGKEGIGGLLPEKSAYDYSVHNCAEVDAVNNALNAGAKIGNLRLTTVHVRTDNYGDLKEACINCTHTFKGHVQVNYSGWHKGGN